MTFKSDMNAEGLGIKVGSVLKRGDGLVRLIEDDESTCPRFMHADNTTEYILLKELSRPEGCLEIGQTWSNSWDSDVTMQVIDEIIVEGEVYVVTKDSDGEVEIREKSDKYVARDWTLLEDESNVKEVTMDEIAEQFNIHVSKLRIKE